MKINYKEDEEIGKLILIRSKVTIPRYSEIAEKLMYHPKVGIKTKINKEIFNKILSNDLKISQRKNFRSSDRKDLK